MCAASTESSTVHSECLKVVAKRLEGDALWVATQWATPWRQAPDLFLEVRDIAPDKSLASGLGIGKIKDLPPEILGMIHEYSSTSPFWRYSAALDLARVLRAAPPNDLSIPLLRVEAWERGGRPEVGEVPDHRLQAVRLTIDCYGIRRIERLVGSPRYRQRRTDHLAFVILEADKIQEVTARFKVCSPLFVNNKPGRFFFSRIQVPLCTSRRWACDARGRPLYMGHAFPPRPKTVSFLACRGRPFNALLHNRAAQDMWDHVLCPFRRFLYRPCSYFL